MENKRCVFSFTTMLQHTSQFGQGFPSKELRDIMGTSGCSRFLPVPQLKSRLKGQSFYDATDIIKNAKEELKMLSKNGFQECFQHFYSCYQKRIVTQGNYFEGNVASVIVTFCISQ